MKIPILVLTNNRPTMLRDMIESVEKYTEPDTYQIIICDNNTNQKEALDLLDELEEKHIVIRNSDNKTFEGLNPGLARVKEFHDKYFIISDPDLKLKPEMPKDWISKMVEILDKTNYPKVGLSLDIDFEEENGWTDHIKHVESHQWKDKVNFDFLDSDCYEGWVDTTMAMYRHDTYTYWQDGSLRFDRAHGIVDDGWIKFGGYNKKYIDKALRINGKFTCEHLGWWLDRKYLVDFPHYYIQSLAIRISSSFQRTAMTLFINTLSEEELAYILPKVGAASKEEFIARL